MLELQANISHLMCWIGLDGQLLTSSVSLVRLPCFRILGLSDRGLGFGYELGTLENTGNELASAFHALFDSTTAVDLVGLISALIPGASYLVSSDPLHHSYLMNF